MLRRVIQVAAVAGTVLGLGGIGVGCLDRPLATGGATLKTNFTTAQQANTIDKVDLLFDIDNSASMGDKESYLAAAVPDLVNRLVNPNCISNTTSQAVGASSGGACPAGSTIEFPPVHNMHIGIISSSLGTRGVTGTDSAGNPNAVCDPTNSNDNTTGAFLDGTPALNTHVDDQAHLLSRAAGSNASETETTLADVGGEGFLDWFPNVPANDGKTAAVGTVLTPQATVLTTAGPATAAGTLEGDFTLLVEGVHNYGCGIESQLETWYRFLVQPDPYASISTSGSAATWVGYDTTIIQQRHDFLRPDSLVAIIVLSDENDSEIDVRSVNGSGYLFMDQNFTPPLGTSQCATDPGSPDCVSCAAGTAATKTDPNCTTNGGVYSSEPGNNWGFYINVRHVHMQQKYGLSAQFPLQRYVLGLTSQNVPDRNHEYPNPNAPYQGGTNNDPQNLNCLNPLFAATLPDGSDMSPATLCNALPPNGTGSVGPRSQNLIFYAHIGGVPHQLLQAKLGVDKDSSGNYICDPATVTSQADCPQKDSLSTSDWTSILGRGVALGTNPYDYTGIDPHMIEAYQPGRTGIAYGTTTTETIPQTVPATGVPPTTPAPDPINGGDWQTDSLGSGGTPIHTLPVDREYACIFPLATPRDCSKPNDPLDSYACDCQATGLKGDQVPPLCGLNTTTNDYQTQYYAKAYPTIRELTLANLLGSQGIISSLCPIHVTDNAAGDDPVYGYRPAVTAIINRLKKALASQCLPQPLQTTSTPTGLQAPCLVLATLPETKAGTEDTVCKGYPGLTTVSDASVLATFRADQHAQWLTAMTGTDPSTLATCEVNQISVSPGTNGNSGSCVGAGSTGEAGWCYVTGTAAGSCDTQAILFTSGTPPNGATVNLQCILENAGDSGTGGGG